MRHSERHGEQDRAELDLAVAGLKPVFRSALAFVGLCALLVGLIWAVNAPTVKADPPLRFCSDLTVCNTSTPCNTICTGPEMEPSTCEFYGV